MENISRIYLRLVSRARRKEEIPPPSTNQANAVHVSSDDSIILNRVRFIIAFFFSSRYIRINRQSRTGSSIAFNGSLSLSPVYIVFARKMETRYTNFSRFTRARTNRRGEGNVSISRFGSVLRGGLLDCSRAEGEGKGKNEKVSNLIRVRITSPDASRRFPSGATLCLYTIIGVWDPGAPLSVFSAPLDSGTPHCNLSELQFAQLRSLESGLRHGSSFKNHNIVSVIISTDPLPLYHPSLISPPSFPPIRSHLSYYRYGVQKLDTPFDFRSKNRSLVSQLSRIDLVLIFRRVRVYF